MKAFYELVKADAERVNGRAPEFWGRYVGSETASFNLTRSEVRYLHSVGCRILLIYSGHTAKPVASYLDGQNAATTSITEARKLCVPKGDTVWIYCDIEFNQNPTQEFFTGWFEKMLGSGYGAGVYAIPSIEGNSFDASFCAAYEDRIPPELFYSSNQPFIATCNLNYKRFKPTRPACNPPKVIPTVVYQYKIRCDVTGAAPGPTGQQIDLDLANGDGFRTMWTAVRAWEAYLAFDDSTEEVSLTYPAMVRCMEEMADGRLVITFVTQRTAGDFLRTLVSNDCGVTWAAGDELNLTAGGFAFNEGKYGGVIALGNKLSAFFRGGGASLQGQSGTVGPLTQQQNATKTVDVTVLGASIGDEIGTITFLPGPLNPPGDPVVFLSGVVIAQNVVRVTFNNARDEIQGDPPENHINPGVVTVTVIKSPKKIYRVDFDPSAATGIQWSGQVAVIEETGTGQQGEITQVPLPARSRDRTTAGLTYTARTNQIKWAFLDANGNLSGAVELIREGGTDLMREVHFLENNQPSFSRRTLNPFNPYTAGSGHPNGTGAVFRKARGVAGWPSTDEQLESTLPITLVEQLGLLTPGDTATIGQPAVYGGGNREQDNDYHCLIGPYVLDADSNYVLQSPQTGGTRDPISPVFVWRRQEGGVWKEDTFNFASRARPITARTYKSHQMPFFITDDGFAVGMVVMATSGKDFTKDGNKAWGPFMFAAGQQVQTDVSVPTTTIGEIVTSVTYDKPHGVATLGGTVTATGIVTVTFNGVRNYDPVQDPPTPDIAAGTVTVKIPPHYTIWFVRRFVG